MGESSPPPPAGWYPDPSGAKGQRYWDGRAWVDQPPTAPGPATAGRDSGFGRGAMIATGLAATFVLLLVVGLATGKNDENDTTGTSTPPPTSSATPSPTTTVAAPPPPPASPATTTPPGGRMNALFCSFTAYTGGPYYVQVFNPKQPPGMCTAADQNYTQEEFQAIPGLTRQCNFDRDEQIAQKQAIVSIYSDETQASIDAARLICTNAGNDIIG